MPCETQISHERWSRRLALTFLMMFGNMMWSMFSSLGFGFYSCAGDICGDDKPSVRRRMFPRTGYSIREIDQAVALGIGIVTLLLCIFDIVQGYWFSVDDEFKGWSRRCIEQIESGNADVKINRWTMGLDRIDKKAKCARTRARHRKREQKTWDELPKDLKWYLLDQAVQRTLEMTWVWTDN
jgi:hypothetical protein